MDILILLGLILLNGLFAMSEIAIVTAKKSRLTLLAAKGSTSAQVALALAEEPTQFLSTVQIGITSIGIMNGIFGESILAEPFSIWLQTVGMPSSFSDDFATVLVVVVITYLSIVIGELVPKRIGQISAERIACIVAQPMRLLAVATKPFVHLLSSSTRALVKLLGFHRIQQQHVTAEDIQAMLEEGSNSGVLEEQEHTMVKNVLRLEGRSIASLMVPRSDIVYLNTALTQEENLQQAMQSHHSRFPVCEQSSDNLIGVIDVKELLAAILNEETIDLKRLAAPVHAVPETLTGLEVLEIFRTSQPPMIFIVDEYGDVKGLVTLQDLLEALTGEFERDHDDAYIVRRDDGSLLLDGMLSIVDFKDCLKLGELPNESHYETLNGLVMLLMAKVPTTGDKVRLGEWTLEVVDMDSRRVDKVLAMRTPASDEA